MEGTVGAPPQRVCPSCARLSWATGPRCPYCRARFRRKTTSTIAWMLVAAVVVTLAGVAGMLVYAGHVFDQKLNDRADAIQQNFDRSLNQVRSDVQKQLDAQGAAITPVPTATVPPVTTPSPTPSPSETPSPSPSPPATTSGGRATPTPSATPIIGP